MIKYNAWENLIAKRIDKLRLEEKDINFYSFFYNQLAVSINILIPMILTLITFFSYKTFYQKLTTPQIYSLLTMFYNLTSPMEFIMYTVSFYLKSLVVSERMGKLAKLKNREPKYDSLDIKKGEIIIENGSFSWINKDVIKVFGDEIEEEIEEDECFLKNINLKIKPGEFVVILGKVGAGKSSLLKSILDELIQKEGVVKKNGAVAFIPQESF